MLRQRYRGGEKVFVDYAGPRFEVVDQESGEVREVMVFVGVLAASNYIFVDLTCYVAVHIIRSGIAPSGLDAPSHGRSSEPG